MKKNTVFSFLEKVSKTIDSVVCVVLENLINENKKTYLPNQKFYARQELDTTVFELISKVVKLNSNQQQEKFNLVVQFYRDNFDYYTASEFMRFFQKLWSKKTPLTVLCQSINKEVNYRSKLHFIQFLYQIAILSQPIRSKEMRLLDSIAKDLGINQAGREVVKEKFKSWFEAEKTESKSQTPKVSPFLHYYQILEISPNASNEDVKRAFRRMAVRHHPDKVSYLDEDSIFKAKLRFQEIIEAYQKIKQERGIKN